MPSISKPNVVAFAKLVGPATIALNLFVMLNVASMVNVCLKTGKRHASVMHLTPVSPAQKLLVTTIAVITANAPTLNANVMVCGLASTVKRSSAPVSVYHTVTAIPKRIPLFTHPQYQKGAYATMVGTALVVLVRTNAGRSV